VAAAAMQVVFLFLAVAAVAPAAQVKMQPQEPLKRLVPVEQVVVDLVRLGLQEAREPLIQAAAAVRLIYQ
jgi:hypothetical protein